MANIVLLGIWNVTKNSQFIFIVAGIYIFQWGPSMLQYAKKVVFESKKT
jgi:hypothetical protein